MKKVSVYVKGGQKSPCYYRIHQYLNHFQDKLDIRYRMMFPECLYDKFMPISKQPSYIKILMGLVMYVRIFSYLIYDFAKQPNVLIINRRISNKIMPSYFKWLLRKISKKSVVIWDYDDQIIENKEVSRSTFDFYAKISDIIFCTHSYLASLVPESFRQKVILLPTTDGDMYKNYNESTIMENRLKILDNEVKLVWVATSVNLPFIKKISPWLDNIAYKLKKQTGKGLSLEVICNEFLDYKFNHLKLTNTKWTREEAINGMLNANIGIMPLDDNEFTRGKGGFKLVQYLSVGLPCVASDVGFNKNVLNSKCGYLVNSESDWEKAIFKLSNPNSWSEYSKEAFQQWNDKFSFEKNLDSWQLALSYSKI